MFHFSCAVNLLPIQTYQCNVAIVLVNCPNQIRLVGVMERYLSKMSKYPISPVMWTEPSPTLQICVQMIIEINSFFNQDSYGAIA